MVMDQSKERYPDFLGIGVQRSGTTWLYDKLEQHPEICFPKHRKEAHYFDKYYQRGEEWYGSLFDHCNNRCKGEITPKYIYDEKCPRRIYELIPDARLILVLRHPIERAYSQFKLTIRESAYDGSFADFLERNPNSRERGLYNEQIKRYLQFFSREQLLILFFFDLKDEPESVLKEIFDFLEVSPSFEPEGLRDKENPSQVPRFQEVYRQIKNFISKLYDWDLVFLVDLAKKMGLKKLFFSRENQKDFPPLTREVEKELADYYRDDVKKLSKLLEKDLLSKWDMEK